MVAVVRRKNVSSRDNLHDDMSAWLGSGLVGVDGSVLVGVLCLMCKWNFSMRCGFGERTLLLIP